VSMGTRDSQSGRPSQARFTTTRWSVVLAAKARLCPDGRQALETLCQAYWYPLYAFVRRQGENPQDAADLTQEFFTRLLEKDWLADVHREKGRFRDFLLAALKHFLSKERHRASARIRGGLCRIVPLDVETAETRYRLESQDPIHPDLVFERQWALTLLAEVSRCLKEEYVQAGKAGLFAALEPYLSARKGEQPCAILAGHLGMTEGAVRVAAHRLRRRYREVLRARITDTVSSPDQVDEEIRHLLEALARP
jgi:DNA-directed RNA polymerase specialized sigma24 family protein